MRYSWQRFTTVKGYKTKSTKGKTPRVRSEGNRTQLCHDLLPLESERMHIIPPLINCYNTCEMLSRRETVGIQCRAYWVLLSHSPPLSSTYQGFSFPEEK